MQIIEESNKGIDFTTDSLGGSERIIVENKYNRWNKISGTQRSRPNFRKPENVIKTLVPAPSWLPTSAVQ